MSRPKPIVLLEYVDEESGKVEQVLETKYLYIVYYDKKPINLKSFNKWYDYPGPTYKKTSFSNKAHAENLAKKMNELFKTNLFTVEMLG